MQTGAITGYFDVAQITLYAFWIFFAGLVIYIRREDKREGYPLVPDATDRRQLIQREGFPATPPPKKWILSHGAPGGSPPERAIAARRTGRWPGAPLEPTGNPMVDGVGPASYALRVDHPELSWDDEKPKIVPLRVATDFFLATEDPDPRGMPVVGADRRVAGKIVDVWVDRSEVIIRYLEAEVMVAGVPRRALMPMTLVQVRGGRRGQIYVNAITAAQFGEVPMLRNPDEVTLLEEDKIMGYFGGGKLYAKPDRMGPLL